MGSAKVVVNLNIYQINFALNVGLTKKQNGAGFFYTKRGGKHSEKVVCSQSSCAP
jgi:hypothetical protein